VTGALAALSFAAVFAVLSWVLLHWAQAAPKRSLEFHGRRAPRAGGGGGPAAIIVGSIAALMICSVPAVSSSGWPRFGQLLPSVFLSLTAAALAWVIAAPVIFALRNNLRIDDGSATRAILQVGAIAIAIGFIPSLALAASILGLAYQFDIVGDSTNGLLLLLSQTLRFTPVAFVLLAPATLGVPDGQLDYMKRIGTTARERFNVTFLHPNFRLHCATLLIIFNLVLNEAVISGVFQGEVPNLADFATRAVTGRSADYGFVGSIILLQLCLFGTLLGIWGRTSATAWSLRNAER
jgi:hypothetical protein